MKMYTSGSIRSLGSFLVLYLYGIYTSQWIIHVAVCAHPFSSIGNDLGSPIGASSGGSERSGVNGGIANGGRSSGIGGGQIGSKVGGGRYNTEYGSRTGTGTVPRSNFRNMDMSLLNDAMVRGDAFIKAEQLKLQKEREERKEWLNQLRKKFEVTNRPPKLPPKMSKSSAEAPAVFLSILIPVGGISCVAMIRYASYKRKTKPSYVMPRYGLQDTTANFTATAHVGSRSSEGYPTELVHTILPSQRGFETNSVSDCEVTREGHSSHRGDGNAASVRSFVILPAIPNQYVAVDGRSTGDVSASYSFSAGLPPSYEDVMESTDSTKPPAYRSALVQGLLA